MSWKEKIIKYAEQLEKINNTSVGMQILDIVSDISFDMIEDLLNAFEEEAEKNGIAIIEDDED